MAKGKGQRPLPSTPGPRDPGAGLGAESGVQPEPASSPAGARPPRDPSAPLPSREARDAAPDTSRYEPYLIAGTNCLAGHERGHELEAGPIGTLPTRRTAWIGLSLLLWCGFGLAFILDAQWISMGLLVLLAWLLFSAVIQRRLGHRGRCWRTRAWRQAWGGLVPGRD